MAKYDKNNNLIYEKNSNGQEHWYEYDENNNLVYFRNSYGSKQWSKYDENNNETHFKLKNSDGPESWYKWKNNECIEITEKEYKEIEFRAKEKEYNSRTKCSRFELMEI